MNKSNFDQRIELPSDAIEETASTLVGFDRHYQMVNARLRIILDPKGIDKWASKFHARDLAMTALIRQHYPLFILSGDVGTGKTITAESAVNRITREMKMEGTLLKLGAQVRGRGLHGEMTQKVRDAFEELEAEAGKKRLAFLIIDEADAVAALRDTEQMHQEEKSAVNTMIQRIDQIRNVAGRAAVFLCTNRIHAIDQAIVRRAVLHLKFSRPDKDERIDLLSRDLGGLGLSDEDIEALSILTGPRGENPGYTYSDFRLRLYLHAISIAFPDKPLTLEVLKQAVDETAPSPEIK